MFAKGDELISIIEGFAPFEYAVPGDATGLQWGDPRSEVQVVLLSLDFSAEILEEALKTGASFIFTHHPYLFRPLKSLDLRKPGEALVARSLREGITLYSAHTNLDVAPGGVNDVLAALIGLENTEVLHPTGKEKLEKLVTFVPEGYEDQVREAISDAGAGWIGNYSHCTFQTPGTGTFLPREGTNPFVGQTGALEKVPEFRLETILPVSRRDSVLQALFKAHPYEEVAYDLYPLQISGQVRGLGRVGDLPQETLLRDLAKRCRVVLDPGGLKIQGDPESRVRRVAVLGGSGGDYLQSALSAGADVFITGDLKFHQAQEAALEGLALIDAGHEATEWPVVSAMADYLREEMRRRGYKTDILISGKRKKMWHFMS